MKIELDDTLSGRDLSKIGANFQKIENALNTQVLYRDNPEGEPNQMENLLDMNGERIINLPAPVSPNDAARLQDVQDAITGLVPASLIPFTPTTDITAATVQTAIEETYTELKALDTTTDNTLRTDLLDYLTAGKGAGMVGFEANVLYAVRTVGHKLLEFKTLEDFGAKGDGTTDDGPAFQAAMNSNATVWARQTGATYRIATQVNIPTSCFTRFIGSGTYPNNSSRIFIDRDGPGFKGAVATTSFVSFENFYAYSLTGYNNAQFIDHDGDLVHSDLKRISLFNFRKIAIDLASAFRCDIDFLGQYCWDYMLKILAGSATRIRFTADHSYAGGIYLGVNTGGFDIEPYTEMICSDNNPAGANASWREMYVSGSNHNFHSGVLSVHTLNNKFPIELNVARAMKFDCVTGFSLGAAPHWINLNATDSGVTIENSPLLTVAGAGIERNIKINPGYAGDPADISIGNISVRNTTSRAWVVFDGLGGIGPATIRQAISITSVSKTATGAYTISIPVGLFGNPSYSVNISIACATVATARFVYATKTQTVLEIRVNDPISTSTVDAQEVCVELTGA